MKKGVLNIKVDYKPLDTYKNVTVRSGSNRQNYNANTRYFEPDRRIDPYVVLVECGVNDTHNIVNGLVNADLTDISWKQSTPAGYKDILNTDKEFKIGTGADKGKLTIFKNVSDLEPVTILFTARFMDNITKRVVNFQESFNLITLPIAESPVLLETSAPVGYNLFPTENNQGLICQADLYRGKDIVPAAYWWYKGNTLLTDTEGYSGVAKNKLFVPADKISKEGDVFKCEVADCSEYLNQLIEQKVETDTEVIQWRELYMTMNLNCINGSKLMTISGSKFVKLTESLTGSIVVSCVRNIVQGVAAQSQVGVMDGGTFYRIGAMIEGENSFVYNVKNSITEVRFYGGNSHAESSGVIIDLHDLKVEQSNVMTPWSPSKEDLQELIDQKTDYYKSNTSLPENYRPNPKPSKLYTADFMLMKKLPSYTEEILYPTSVSPESTTVQVEMVLNTNNGIIQQPEQFLSVGWLKQADGTFKYKGFKVNIAIADIKALNASNKQLDYELREDLTLKP